MLVSTNQLIFITGISAVSLFAANFSQLRWQKKTSDHSVPLSTILPDLFTKIKFLRDDINVFYNKKDVFDNGGARVQNFTFKPCILIGEEFAQQMNKNALNFIYKHEVGHIYYNHMLKLTMLPIAINTITALACFILGMSLSGPATIGFTVGITLVHLIANRILARISEDSADDFAIQHCTDEELMGGKLYFQIPDEIQSKVSDVLKKSAPKYTLTPNTSFFQRFFDPHSNNEKRIKKIELAMKKRNITVEELETNPIYLQIKKDVFNYYIKKIVPTSDKCKEIGLDPTLFDIPDLQPAV